MTPKEKAEEFYNKFSNTAESWIYGKRCALLAVILIIQEYWGGIDNFNYQYWQEVKQEIEKL